MSEPGSRAAHRLGAWSAGVTFFGILLSGPVSLAVLNATHPQPAWQGPETFARHYHPIQSLPFFAGISMVSGFVLLVAAVHAAAQQEHKVRTSAALAFVAVFASLVFLNYILQTTFVPELARDYVDANGPVLAALTMSNPTSLGWGLEMWGYGFLGVATWLAAPVFGTSGFERATSMAFVANGPASIVPALWTALRPGWEMTPAGLAAFGVWNLLVAAMCGLAFVAFRNRVRAASSHVAS